MKTHMTVIMMEGLDAALTLIKKFEGCRLKAYRCPAGRWTIGYGQTAGVKEGMVWTQEKAEENLRETAMIHLEWIIVSCPLLKTEPPGRLAACISFSYNVGMQNFSESSVCRLTRAGRFREAADAFLLWNKSRGKVLPGLVRRREAERAVYLGKA